MKIARNLCTKYSVFISLALLISGGALLHGTAFADETFTQTATITLPGASANVPGSLTSFDIGFVDPQLGFYFLADRTNKTVDEIRTSDNHVTRQLAKGELVGANGVITANNHKEVWIGDNVPANGTSSVKVISLATGHVTHTIDTKGLGRTDELCVDPQHHVVLAANDVDLFVKFISTDTYKVIGTLFFDGSDPKAQNVKSNNGIEQCQWSPRTGKIYLNIPQVGGTPGKNDTPGVVVMINPASMMVQKVFPIESSSVCRGNQGLAIGPQRELLIGCSASGTGSVILNELNGSEIRSLPGLNGSDEVWYNPGDNHYFLALGNHTAGGVVGGAAAPILGVADQRGDQDIEDAGPTTLRGSHSVAADPVNNQVYVPINGGNLGANTALCGAGVNGCIAVFTTTNDDPGRCTGPGTPAHGEGRRGDPRFLRTVCPNNNSQPHGD